MGFTIGIYSASSQSGRAFLADLSHRGLRVCGYVRQSPHGDEFADALAQAGGIVLDRPDNSSGEVREFVPLPEGTIVRNAAELVAASDVIIMAIPSHHLRQAAESLVEGGLLEKRPTLVLSPSRSFASPYLWRILGEGYPIICFSTCPYSCKAPNPHTSYIKRRKRVWTASLEGDVPEEGLRAVREAFPHVLYNLLPYTTTLGNIGVVFHPGPSLLKREDILRAAEEGRAYSYYMEAIAQDAAVASHIEQVDQLRLAIADKLGLPTFGLAGKENDEEWIDLIESIQLAEDGSTGEVGELRTIRHQGYSCMEDRVISARHWLHVSYGVRYLPGETLQSAIARTGTYQKTSVPQERYIFEDLPTGLIPLRAMALRLGVCTSAVDALVDLFRQHFPDAALDDWRDLEGFSTEYLTSYLTGGLSRIIPAKEAC